MPPSTLSPLNPGSCKGATVQRPQHQPALTTGSWAPEVPPKMRKVQTDKGLKGGRMGETERERASERAGADSLQWGRAGPKLHTPCRKIPHIPIVSEITNAQPKRTSRPSLVQLTARVSHAASEPGLHGGALCSQGGDKAAGVPEISTSACQVLVLKHLP